MFILVLTILGLSLFSLSGFESQFTIKSLHRSAAFNAASGGLERARFALLETNQLESVTKFLPRDGVVYARAIQGPDPELCPPGDSIGPIKDNGQDVWVRVRAVQDGATVELQGRYHASTPDDYYKRLITTWLLNINGTKSNAHLTGEVAQPQSASLTWYSPTPPPADLPPFYPPIDRRVSMILPDLATYMASRMPLAGLVTESTPGRYDLPAGVGNWAYFKTPRQTHDWIIDESDDATINVTGTAVWLMSADTVGVLGTGCAWFHNHVTVTGDPLTARLIIIANTSRNIQQIDAIRFSSGITSGTPNLPLSGVPVIIATPGIIDIGCGPASDQSSFVSYMSLYAGRVALEGPVTGTSHFWHAPSMVSPVLDPLMDTLYGLGILPNASVGGDRLSFVPGTWQVIGASSN